MKNFFRLLLLWMSFILISSCRQKELVYTKLDQFSRIDTMSNNTKPYYFKTDCYIVENYKDNLENERAVDSLVYANRAKDLAKYAGYVIEVYKKSDATDIEHLRKNPKDFDNESFVHDMIYVYKWSKGVWVSKMKFKGRETVEAQPMIRED